VVQRNEIIAELKAEIERLEVENTELKYDLDNLTNVKETFVECVENDSKQRRNRLLRLLGCHVEENDLLREENQNLRERVMGYELEAMKRENENQMDKEVLHDLMQYSVNTTKINNPKRP